MRQEQKTSEMGEPPKKSQVAPPSITLPKGGGAIRGMGEKFAANPVTDTGSMSVPIATSPDRSGFGPQLSPAYEVEMQPGKRLQLPKSIWNNLIVPPLSLFDLRWK